MKMELIPFGRGEVDNLLRETPERADELPFGAILLDRSGLVLHYNKAEGFHAGKVPAEVVGKVFFTDIASCAQGTRLHEEFLKYHDKGFVNVVFDYAFDYDRAPAAMRIHMKSTEDGAACWMFVKRV